MSFSSDAFYDCHMTLRIININTQIQWLENMSKHIVLKPSSFQFLQRKLSIVLFSLQSSSWFPSLMILRFYWCFSKKMRRQMWTSNYSIKAKLQVCTSSISSSNSPVSRLKFRWNTLFFQKIFLGGLNG